MEPVLLGSETWAAGLEGVRARVLRALDFELSVLCVGNMLGLQ